MLAYIIRRLLLIPVTLTGIFLTSFLLINFAPGGPLEALIAEMQGISTDRAPRASGSAGAAGPRRSSRRRVMFLLCNCMSYSPQLGVERLVFFDDARAVADWDAQLDPVVPLERRDRHDS